MKPALIITSLTLLLVMLFGTWVWQSRETIAADLLSERLGIPVTIDELNIKPAARITEIALKGIHFNHAALIGQTSIDSVYAAIDLTQYLETGMLHIDRLEVSTTRLRLSGKPLTGAGRSQRLPVIRNWRLEAAAINYADADQDINAVVNSCTGTSKPGQSIVNISCDMLLNNESLKATGQYNLPDRQLVPVPHRLDIYWGDILLTIRGKMDNPAQLTGADLKLSLRGPSTEPLQTLFGIDEFRDGAFDVNAGIVDLGNTLNLQLRAAAAGFEANVAGIVSYPSLLDNVDATFRLQGPSLYEYGALFDYLAFEPLPFSFSGSLKKSGEAIQFQDLQMRLAEGTLSGSIAIPELSSTRGLKLNLSGKGFSPNVIQPILPDCPLPTEPMDWRGSIDVDTNGAETLSLSVSGIEQALIVDGLWNDPQGIRPRQLKIRATGATLTELGQCVGIKVSADLKTQIDATYTMQPGGWTVTDLNLTTGTFVLSGNLSGADTTPAGISAALELRTASIRALARALYQKTGPLKDTPAIISATLASEGDLLKLENLAMMSDHFSGTATGVLTDHKGAAGLDLATRITGDNLLDLLEDSERASQAPAPFDISADIKRSRGGWLIENIDARIAQTTVTASLKLTDQPRFMGSSAAIQTRGQSLENLLGPWVDYPVPALPFSADVSVNYNADLLEVRNVTIDIGEHRSTGSLVIDNPPDLSRSSGTLQLKGPSTREFVALAGGDLPILDRPYSLNLTLTGAADNIALQNFTFNAGETSVTGSGNYEARDKPWFDISLNSSSFYLPLVRPSLLDESSDTAIKSSRLFSDEPIDTGWLNRVEGRLRLDVERFWTSEDQTTQFDGTLTLNSGTLATSDLRWKGPHVSGSTQFSASDTERGLQLAFDSSSTRLPIIWLLAGEAKTSNSKDTTARLQFDTSGRSIAEMMASANGKLLFKGGSGTIKAGMLEGFFGDILHTLTDQVYGRSKSKTTQVECSAGAITIANGRASVHPGIAFRTEKVDSYVTGKINLRTEEPDLAMLTKPRTGIGVSAAGAVAPRVNMTGSLARPKYSIDTRSAALATGLAYFSGGASVLASGLWNRLVQGTSDPCQDLYNQAVKQPAFQF